MSNWIGQADSLGAGRSADAGTLELVSTWKVTWENVVCLHKACPGLYVGRCRHGLECDSGYVRALGLAVPKANEVLVTLQPSPA